MTNLIFLNKAPSRSQAEQIVKELIKEGRLSLSRHCEQRMIERGIASQQLITCLNKGRITEDPWLSHRNGGGYEMTMERVAAGESLRVGVCLKLIQRVYVITVIRI